MTDDGSIPFDQLEVITVVQHEDGVQTALIVKDTSQAEPRFWVELVSGRLGPFGSSPKVESIRHSKWFYTFGNPIPYGQNEVYEDLTFLGTCFNYQKESNAVLSLWKMKKPDPGW